VHDGGFEPAEPNQHEPTQLKLPTTVEEFRIAGHKHVDWIADYLKDPRKFPWLRERHPPGELVGRNPSYRRLRKRGLIAQPPSSAIFTAGHCPL